MKINPELAALFESYKSTQQNDMAAAILAVGHLLLERSEFATAPPIEATGTLSFGEAARELGYSKSGLRKIVDYSRKVQSGEVSETKPTIRFYQPGPKRDIKFEREWIEEFKTKHTVNPSRPKQRTPSPARKAPGKKPRRVTVNDGRFGF